MMDSPSRKAGGFFRPETGAVPLPSSVAAESYFAEHPSQAVRNIKLVKS